MAVHRICPKRDLYRASPEVHVQQIQAIPSVVVAVDQFPAFLGATCMDNNPGQEWAGWGDSQMVQGSDLPASG